MEMLYIYFSYIYICEPKMHDTRVNITCTPQTTQLAIFNASEGVWPWVQFESVHPTLVLPSTAVQRAMAWESAVALLQQLYQWQVPLFPTWGLGGWFIVRTCWLKMCRIVTKHPGDGEESSPLPVFPNVFARFKTIHQSVLNTPKPKSGAKKSIQVAGWKVTPNLVSYNITLDACAKGKVSWQQHAVFAVRCVAAAWALEVF